MEPSAMQTEIHDNANRNIAVVDDDEDEDLTV